MKDGFMKQDHRVLRSAGANCYGGLSEAENLEVEVEQVKRRRDAMVDETMWKTKKFHQDVRRVQTGSKVTVTIITPTA